MGAHAKFTNYAFGVREFLRRIAEAADHVRNHPEYKAAWEKRYGHRKEQKQEPEPENKQGEREQPPQVLTRSETGNNEIKEPRTKVEL